MVSCFKLPFLWRKIVFQGRSQQNTLSLDQGCLVYGSSGDLSLELTILIPASLYYSGSSTGSLFSPLYVLFLLSFSLGKQLLVPYQLYSYLFPEYLCLGEIDCLAGDISLSFSQLLSKDLQQDRSIVAIIYLNSGDSYLLPEVLPIFFSGDIEFSFFFAYFQLKLTGLVLIKYDGLLNCLEQLPECILSGVLMHCLPFSNDFSISFCLLCMWLSSCCILMIFSLSTVNLCRLGGIYYSIDNKNIKKGEYNYCHIIHSSSTTQHIASFIFRIPSRADSCTSTYRLSSIHRDDDIPFSGLIRTIVVFSLSYINCSIILRIVGTAVPAPIQNITIFWFLLFLKKSQQFFCCRSDLYDIHSQSSNISIFGLIIYPHLSHIGIFLLLIWLQSTSGINSFFDRCLQPH